MKSLRKLWSSARGEEHKSAFADLKNYLVKLLTLSNSKVGEALSLYLATSDGTISTVLIREEGRRQFPAYFISRALKGLETRYQPLEKLTLALVNAARRLWPYIRAHPIRVFTDHPLQQILTKSEASGRIAKWAIEMGEHDVSYCPRQAIKGQTLAYFLVETNFLEKPKPIEPTSVTSEDESMKEEPKDC